MNFEKIDSVLIGKTKIETALGKIIIGFDLDHTIIKPSNGKTFSKSTDDFVFTFDNVPSRLCELSKDHHIVFFSNQSALKNETKLATFKTKIENLAKLLQCPFTIMASIEDDNFRKPRTGMTSLLPKESKLLCYIGDAAGRQNDFADSDVKFAINLSVPFYTPEEYFSHQKKKIEDVENVLHYRTSIGRFPSINPCGLLLEKNREFDEKVIICVGLPASGKSTFVSNIILSNKDYVYINQDILKTKANCLKIFEKELSRNKKVIVDNTNVSQDQRKLYISLAKKHNVHDILCLNFTTPFNICLHNNYYRSFTKNQKRIPMIAYNILKSKFQAAIMDEGFSNIIDIPFSANFSNDSDREDWERWYI